MNTSGFRACVKELYGTRYDPLSVSYAVLKGQLIQILGSFMNELKQTNERMDGWMDGWMDGFMDVFDNFMNE